MTYDIPKPINEKSRAFSSNGVPNSTDLLIFCGVHKWRRKAVCRVLTQREYITGPRGVQQGIESVNNHGLVRNVRPKMSTYLSVTVSTGSGGIQVC